MTVIIDTLQSDIFLFMKSPVIFAFEQLLLKFLASP